MKANGSGASARFQPPIPRLRTFRGRDVGPVLARSENQEFEGSNGSGILITALILAYIQPVCCDWSFTSSTGVGSTCECAIQRGSDGC